MSYECKDISASSNELTVWTKTQPKIDDEGIWMPTSDFVPEGCDTNYKLIIPKDIFIEAYNRWIKEE